MRLSGAPTQSPDSGTGSSPDSGLPRSCRSGPGRPSPHSPSPSRSRKDRALPVRFRPPFHQVIPRAGPARRFRAPDPSLPTPAGRADGSGTATGVGVDLSPPRRLTPTPPAVLPGVARTRNFRHSGCTCLGHGARPHPWGSGGRDAKRGGPLAQGPRREGLRGSARHRTGAGGGGAGEPGSRRGRGPWAGIGDCGPFGPRLWKPAQPEGRGDRAGETPAPVPALASLAQAETPGHRGAVGRGSVRGIRLSQLYASPQYRPRSGKMD